MGSFWLQTMATPYLDSSALPEALASNGWLGSQRCCPGENDGCVCSNRVALVPRGIKTEQARKELGVPLSPGGVVNFQGRGHISRGKADPGGLPPTLPPRLQPQAYQPVQNSRDSKS